MAKQFKKLKERDEICNFFMLGLMAWPCTNVRYIPDFPAMLAPDPACNVPFFRSSVNSILLITINVRIDQKETFARAKLY